MCFWASEQLVAARAVLLIIWVEVLALFRGITEIVLAFPRARMRQLRDLLDYLESAWQEPDDGMWEARGPRRHYTQSKVMAWLAFDRAIALAKRFKLEGPVRRWEQIRA